MVVYEAHLDETGGEDGAFPLIGVAGYLIEAERVQQFETAWASAKGDLPYIHMKDFAPGRGIYAHMSKSERTAMGISLIAAIKDNVSIAAASFAPLGRFAKDAGDEPYSFSLQMVSHLLQAHLEIKHSAEFEVSIFYEKGRKYAFKAVEVFERSKDPRIKSFSPISKEESGLVQAADMLTWHLAKYIKDIVDGSRNPRKDFESLLDVPGLYFQYFPSKAGINQIIFDNRDLLRPKVMQGIKEIYDMRIPLNYLWAKYGVGVLGGKDGVGPDG